jgi:hypothetical protein
MKEPFNTENIESKESDNVDNTSIMVIIFIFLVAIFWGVIRFLTQKKQKTDFYEIYDVTDKTFSKWVLHFCRESITLEYWKKKRLLTRDEFNAITKSLGNPTPKKHYTKKDLQNEFGFKKYDQLRWEVVDFAEIDDKGNLLTEEIYKSLSKFPPIIKDRIAMMFDELKSID